MKKITVFSRIIIAALCLATFGINLWSCNPDPAETVTVTGISLDQTGMILNSGDMEPLKATVIPADATNRDVAWMSGNETVATVDKDGIVTALSQGATVITATTVDGGFTAACDVVVDDSHVRVRNVFLDHETLLVYKGREEALTATVTPEDATDRTVTWASSDENVATVDHLGVVKGISDGTATITVTTNDGGKTASCEVTVESKTTVYSAGFRLYNATNMTYATIWRDGEILYELTDGSVFAYADDVFVTEDGDIYAVGYDTPGNMATNLYVWKNGEHLYTLSDGTTAAYGPTIQVVDGDVYVGGYESWGYSPGVGRVWKNGEVLYTYGGMSSLTVCLGMYVYGSDVYMAGYELKPDGDRIAKYWKNDQEYPLHDNSTEGEAGGEFFDGTDVYVAGWSFSAERYTTATMWKNGVRTQLGHGNSVSTSYAVERTDGRVYVGGWQNDADWVGRATVWTDGVAMEFDTPYASVVNDIRVFEGDVYAGGKVNDRATAPNTIGTIWKNGEELYSLSDGVTNASIVHGICVTR